MENGARREGGDLGGDEPADGNRHSTRGLGGVNPQKPSLSGQGRIELEDETGELWCEVIFQVTCLVFFSAIALIIKYIVFLPSIRIGSEVTCL